MKTGFLRYDSWQIQLYILVNPIKDIKVIVNGNDISRGKPCYENGIYKSEAPSLISDP